MVLDLTTVYSMAEAHQVLMLWINSTRRGNWSNYREVWGTICIQMVKDVLHPMFDKQIKLFDVREHNSGQFVWVLMETHVYNCNYSMRFSLIFSYGPA